MTYDERHNLTILLAAVFILLFALFGAMDVADKLNNQIIHTTESQSAN